MKTDNNICKIDVSYDEFCNGLGDYYRRGSIAEALRDQAGLLEWHVTLLRKLADLIDEFGEEDLELDVEYLTISAPSELVQRLINEELAISCE